MNTALALAKRQLSQAEEAVGQALLREDIRSAVPRVPVTCPITGVQHETECPAWSNLYYGRSAKHVARFQAELPALAARMQNELTALVDALSAKAKALAVEKQAKSVRKAEKLALAAEKALHKARPLPSRNPVAAENYDVLSAAFSAYRNEYAERCVTASIRAQAGRVVRNVDPKEVSANAYAAFDGYMAKLAIKITEKIESAELVGSLWNGSNLRVRTAAGEQVWHTHCIINRSVYGKLFNQWPTRRIN